MKQEIKEEKQIESIKKIQKVKKMDRIAIRGESGKFHPKYDNLFNIVIQPKRIKEIWGDRIKNWVKKRRKKGDNKW